MKNSGAMKMYLAMAALLAIAEILLLATGNAKPSNIRTGTFCIFLSLWLSVHRSRKN